MNDRIVDVCGDKARAAAQFNFRGYWISFSQIFNCKVAVFEHIDGEMVKESNTVEDAIAWVNTQW